MVKWMDIAVEQKNPINQQAAPPLMYYFIKLNK